MDVHGPKTMKRELFNWIFIQIFLTKTFCPSPQPLLQFAKRYSIILKADRAVYCAVLHTDVGPVRRSPVNHVRRGTEQH
jgi:hypothetical protein